MKWKLGIVISLMSLSVCLSSTEDINPNSTTTFARSRKPRFIPLAVTGAVTAVRSAVTIFNDVTSLISGIETLKNLIKPNYDDEIFRETVLRKLTEIQGFSSKIDQLKEQVDGLSVEIRENSDRVINSVEFSHAKRVVEGFKKNSDWIDSFYKTRFDPVLSKMKNYDASLVKSYLQEIVNNDELLKSLSYIMSDITSSPTTRSSIFSAMSEYYNPKNGYKFQCEHISPLDDLHIFGGNVMSTVTRGYTAIILSYQYLKTNSTNPRDYRFYQDRQNTIFEAFKSAVETISRHAKIDFDSLPNSNFRASYACDSRKWEEGKNFIRVKNYVSVQIGNGYWGDHVDNPKEVAKSKEYDCGINGFAIYRAVLGAEKDTQSNVCTTPFSPTLENPYSKEYSELMHPWSRVWESRRCLKGVSTIFGIQCEADHYSDPELSIRKLSVKLQECDTSKNEVVTDARFAEINNVIYIQLRCGVLRSGKILPSTLRWVEDDGHYSLINPPERVVLSSRLKSFNIDNVLVGKEELVTGAQFEVVDDHFISLKVRGHKVNNYYGENSFGRDNIYSAPRSAKPRKNIDISFLERPKTFMNQTYEIGTPGESYINLTLSKWSNEYNNNAVVPYFDMTAYRVNDWDLNVSPLGGLGLFYKNVPDHTGFLAFKHLSPIYLQFANRMMRRTSYYG